MSRKDEMHQPKSSVRPREQAADKHSATTTVSSEASTALSMAHHHSGNAVLQASFEGASDLLSEQLRTDVMMSMAGIEGDSALAGNQSMLALMRHAKGEVSGDFQLPRGSGRPLSIPMGIAKDTCGHFRAPRGQSYAIVLPVTESVSTITKSTSTGAK